MRNQYFNKKCKRNTMNIILCHLNNNKKEYIIVSLIFVIGIMLGAVFINNLDVLQIEKLTTYIKDLVAKIKENDTLNQLQILKKGIKQDICIVVFLWIMGSTVIRIITSISYNMF